MTKLTSEQIRERIIQPDVTFQSMCDAVLAIVDNGEATTPEIYKALWEIMLFSSEGPEVRRVYDAIRESMTNGSVFHFVIRPPTPVREITVTMEIKP